MGLHGVVAALAMRNFTGGFDTHILHQFQKANQGPLMPV